MHDDQSVRAKCRYAQILAVQDKFTQADSIFEELEKYWAEKPIGLNPYQARFYMSHAEYLMNPQSDNKERALENYRRAHQIISQADGANAPFLKEINTKIADLVRRLNPVEPNVLSESSSALLFQPAPTAVNTAQVTQPVHNPGNPGIGLGNGGAG